MSEMICGICQEKKLGNLSGDGNFFGSCCVFTFFILVDALMIQATTLYMDISGKRK